MLSTDGKEPMANVEYKKNDGYVPTWFKDRPPYEPIAEYWASYQLEDEKRTYALIVLDMEEDYRVYVDYMLPNAEKVLNKFRELKVRRQRSKSAPL